MNVLFLTMGDFQSIESRSIYADLLRCFRNHGHHVFIIAPGKEKKAHYMVENENDACIIHVSFTNLTKTKNLIKKGLSQVSVGRKYKKVIKLFFSDVKFDLVLYSTPPITLIEAIEYVKSRDGAKTYLLLKDIFPQNAVDLGMFTTNGIKGIVYKYFRSLEKRLYSISDRIGCMSQANVDYVISHNPEVNPNIVEVCPNSIEVEDKSVDDETRLAIRNKYGIPLDRKVFVYGGNLGKPQGIPFLIECLKKCEAVDGAYFLIVGDGTEYHLLEEYVQSSQPKNVKLMRRLPIDDYDTMVGGCDIGLIFLDHRFTIPNFPSRLLSYMQAKLPVLACTDPNTDIGRVITDGGFGWWCESNNSNRFKDLVSVIIKSQIVDEGEMVYTYVKNNWNVTEQYKSICNSLSILL